MAAAAQYAASAGAYSDTDSYLQPQSTLERYPGSSWHGQPGIVLCVPPPAPRMLHAEPMSGYMAPVPMPYGAWAPVATPMHPAYAPHLVAGYGGMPDTRNGGHPGLMYPPAPMPHHVAPHMGAWYVPAPWAYAPAPPMSYAMAHALRCGLAPVPHGVPEVRQSSAEAKPKPAPPRAIEDSAVPLASFAAEAFWRTSAELLGLKRRLRSDRLASLALSPLRDPPALESDSTQTEPRSPQSSEYPSEPCTPDPDGVSTPSSPGSETLASTNSLSDSMGSYQLSDAIESMNIGDRAAQSAALSTLVRSIGMYRGSPTLPSLEHCGTVFVGAPPKLRAASSSSGREHSPLLGEPSPAFRRFVHQVLSQTLVSPAALLLALYYVRRQLPSILGMGTATDDEIASAVALYVQPPSSAPFRLLALGLMLANKYLDDNTFLNKTWHEVTGIPLADINRMEAYFLCRTQYAVVVPLGAWHQHLTRIRAYELDNTQDADESALLVQAIDKLLAEGSLVD